MAINRGIVIVSFGKQRESMVLDSISNIRKYSNLPIMIYTDYKIFERNTTDMGQVVLTPNQFKWKDSPRWGVRNCNYWSAYAALNTFDSCLVLNDDMRIVSKGFEDGFTLAERFGVCVPLNPRVYVKYNAMGTDANDEDFKEGKDGPKHAPACNMSPLFVSRTSIQAQTLICAYMIELQTCMRGTLAFWKASWKTGITPLYLPEQWCVCGSSAKFIKNLKKPLQGKVQTIESIMLHWGQPEVREVYNGMD